MDRESYSSFISAISHELPSCRWILSNCESFRDLTIRRLQLLQHPWRLAALGQSQVVLEANQQKYLLQICCLIFEKKNDWDIVS